VKEKKLSIIDLLVVVAIVALLGAILFPVFAQAAKAQKNKGNTVNLKKIAHAARLYSQDYDDKMPIVINGRYRDLKNMPDGTLDEYGEPRSDMWPLIMLPYVGDRTTYIDPQRGDAFAIYSGPALATSDPGFNALENTYRNQNRFSMFALNYYFLSPLVIPASRMSESDPVDFAIGQSHGFAEAEAPNRTVFFAPSDRGLIPQSGTDAYGTQDWQRGFSVIDAPGLWDVLIASTTPYVVFWNGTNCSGDWCGTDLNPDVAGVQTNEGYFYKYPVTQGNNTMFLDLHVKFMTAVDLAAGTDYLTATPQDGGSGAFGGGATIIDKSQYIWNLNEQFFGL